MKIYKNPLYYEIAFSWRDIKKEVNFFEKCINKFSRIKVKNVLEIACGPSPYLLELNKRHYKFTGLDNSPKMLRYSLDKAKSNNIRIKTVKADMLKFKIRSKYDFAFIMLSSIFVKSNKKFLSHLDSMARALNKGALYLIEGGINFNWLESGKQKLLSTWKIQKDDIKIKISYKEIPVKSSRQKYIHNLILDVTDNGKRKILEEKMLLKHIYPEEFLGLIKQNGKFEFLGWYEDFKFRKKSKPKRSSRVISVLRKR